MTRRARRRRLSMTPLIDVIFLLLLFFMLSSTFSRYADVEWRFGHAGGGAAGVQGMAFLRLGEDALTLNGVTLPLDALAARLEALDVPGLIVSVRPSVSAQRMTDLLVHLRQAPAVEIILVGDG